MKLMPIYSATTLNKSIVQQQQSHQSRLVALFNYRKEGSKTPSLKTECF
jgi:hypothetical protein